MLALLACGRLSNDCGTKWRKSFAVAAGVPEQVRFSLQPDNANHQRRGADVLSQAAGATSEIATAAAHDTALPQHVRGNRRRRPRAARIASPIIYQVAWNAVAVAE